MDKKILYYYLKHFQPYLQVHNPGLQLSFQVGPKGKLKYLFKTCLDKATVDQTWCCWRSCLEGVFGFSDLQWSTLTSVYQGVSLGTQGPGEAGA